VKTLYKQRLSGDGRRLRHTLGVLKAERLGKRYGARWLFRNIEFDLQSGESLVIAGANGTGKSTMIKIIAGLLPASEGEVSLPNGDSRLTLGYSGLDLNVYPYLTALEHVTMAASLRGRDCDAMELLTDIGLARAANQRAGEFSTGMRARLKLVMATQAKPQVLLLDEPSASLDEVGRNLVEKIVSEQRQRGVCLIATNDPLERRLGSHVLELV
jgi:heme exporter protein A